MKNFKISFKTKASLKLGVQSWDTMDTLFTCYKLFTLLQIECRERAFCA